MDFEFIADPVQRQQAVDAYKASIDGMKVDFQNSLQAEVQKAIEPIKANHDKLLDEKKKLQQKFEGITDPQEALAALKMIKENEDFQLMKDGKLDEVIAKRTSALMSDHEAKVGELTAKLTNHEMTATKYQSLYKDTVRDLEIRRAAIAAGIVSEGAIGDVLRQGRELFSIAEDEKSVESRDKNGHLRKIDDEVMTTELWLDSLKKTHAHYWPASVGGNFNPNLLSGTDLEVQITEAAKAGNTALYRELRAKQKAARSGK